MPAVQVREMETETYDMLKASAARNTRSISQQAEWFIAEGLRNEASRRRMEGEERYDPTWGVHLRHEAVPVFAETPIERELSREERIEKLQRLFREMESLPKVDLSGLPDPVDIIREMRDERSEQLFRLAQGEFE